MLLSNIDCWNNNDSDSNTSIEEASRGLFLLRDMLKRILPFSQLSSKSGEEGREDSFLQHEMLRQDRRQESVLGKDAICREHLKDDFSSQSAKIYSGEKPKSRKIWYRIRFSRKSILLVAKFLDERSRQMRTLWFCRQTSLADAPQGSKSKKQRAEQFDFALRKLPYSGPL